MNELENGFKELQILLAQINDDEIEDFVREYEKIKLVTDRIFLFHYYPEMSKNFNDGKSVEELIKDTLFLIKKMKYCYGYKSH